MIVFMIVVWQDINIAGEIIESLPPEQVNQTQTFIKFYCFEKPKEELTPSSKIEKGV